MVVALALAGGRVLVEEQVLAEALALAEGQVLAVGPGDTVSMGI